MTTILTLESSASACSVALGRGEREYLRSSLTPREHTKLLLPMIEEVLREAGIGLEAVDALAFPAGPGSFTGLRIGFGIVQGLAFSRDIPVIPVSTLEALAEAARIHFSLDEGARILPALDARMQEIYWGLYQVGPDNTLIAEQLNRISSAIGVAVTDGVEVDVGAGDGWASDGIPVEPKVRAPDLVLLADAVLNIARIRYSAGKLMSVEDAELLYLRDEVAWKKRERPS